ncbi:MAG: DNA methylase [Lachnospiraceae bacterium]|nr:DNA methylase [Lachnospiraceae bacterium]
MDKQQTYICIDLKSFYASVECVERGLDPLKANLVVADTERTEKTICLAVSPALKSYGVPGRARLFEVVQKVKEINADRKRAIKGEEFTGSSYMDPEVRSDPHLKLDYIAAKPRMAYYMKYSADIYNIYLRYIAAENIHVYSVDEVFIDATPYLKLYNMTGHELAIKLIREVLTETGITATAGVGTNMYLAKIAMDIVAKKMPADKDGVRIAELDEMSYRYKLWDHRPITDFWRVGRGYERRLREHGMLTMGDVARCAVKNQELLYKLFGVNAELLIDHAFGWEPCTIAEIKAYKPESHSISQGQVLSEPYDFKKARLVVKEMIDQLALELVDKGLVCDQLVLTVGYDKINLEDPKIREAYKGEIKKNYYGQLAPKHAQGSYNLGEYTSSSREIIDGMMELYDSIVDPILFVRRMYVVANHVKPEAEVMTAEEEGYVQLDLFTDPEAAEAEKKEKKESREKERNVQQAILDIRKKYGKNAILKGMNFEEGATARERNKQIGGHKA